MTSSVQSHVGTTSNENLRTLVDKGARLEDIAAFMDALDDAGRVAEMRRMGRAQQSKLWEMTKGKSTATMESFLDGTSEKTIIYAGQNVLPVASAFEKRFYRLPSGLVVGYNQNPPLITSLFGPGYFQASQVADGEILFDYTKKVETQPPGWPALAENKGLLVGLVFKGMLDYVRTVSRRTYIGAAFIGTKPRNQYFMITRAP